MGTINTGLQVGEPMMQGMGGGLEGAEQDINAAEGAIAQALTGQQPGGQGSNGGPGGLEQQSGPQSIEQQLSQAEQTLQQLAEELGSPGGGSPQQLGGQAGGGEVEPQGVNTTTVQGGGQGQGGSQAPIINSQNASQFQAYDNLVDDAAGGGSSHDTTNDLNGLTSELKNAAESGQISAQQATTALADIGSGNMSALEQAMSGTSGTVVQN